MKKITLLVAFVATIGIVNAQSDYSKAIGVRVSPPSNYDVIAASFKTFLTDAGAIELNAGFGGHRYNIPGDDYRTNSVSFSAAYQHHFDIKPVDGLKWYIGGGATVFHTSSTYKNSGYRGTGVGLFPTGGADYKFKSIPLNVSADWRPTFLVTAPGDYANFLGDKFGVSARYTF